jgi:hypothetical protein
MSKYHVSSQVFHVAIEKKVPRRLHPAACVTLHRLQCSLQLRHLLEIHPRSALGRPDCDQSRRHHDSQDKSSATGPRRPSPPARPQSRNNNHWDRASGRILLLLLLLLLALPRTELRLTRLSSTWLTGGEACEESGRGTEKIHTLTSRGKIVIASDGERVGEKIRELGGRRGVDMQGDVGRRRESESK